MLTSIISQCEKLTEEDIDLITIGHSRYFEREIQSLIPELPTFTQRELTIVMKVINGLIESVK
jgi:hypothetical protein